MCAPGAQRPDLVAATQQESHKTKRKNGLAQAGAEVLPKDRMRAGIGRRKEKRKHEQEAASASGANENAENQRDADGQLTISDEKGDRRRVSQDEAAKRGDHEGISAAFEEAVDPVLEAAVKRELRAEDFVLAENEEENADGDAEEGEGAAVGGFNGAGLSHGILLLGRRNDSFRNTHGLCERYVLA